MSMKDFSGGGFGEDFSEAKVHIFRLVFVIVLILKESIISKFSYFIA
jgi:hypothetical protein